MATTIIANRHLVEAPPTGQRRYGLFDVATVTDDLNARMMAAGVQFPELDCGPALDEYDAIRRTLAAGEQTAVENVVWSGGDYATDPALTTAAGVVTVTPLADGAGAALAALEASFYAVYGYVGVLHVNTAAHAALNDYVDRRGGAGALTTEIGTRVAYGAGYGIDGPLGVAPAAGSVWAFMTPPVQVRRSEIIVPDVLMTLDRLANQYHALAERVYLHAWACDVVHAVQIPVAAPQAVIIPAGP